MPAHLGVVVELARLLGLRGELVQADDLAFEQERVRRAILRIHEPHVRVDEVLGGELALLALERRIGREIDALRDLERVGLAVVRDHGHAFGGHRHDLRRAREIVVGEQPLEDRLDDRGGIEIRDAHRIEAVLAGGEIPADDLVRIGRGRCGCGDERCGGADRCDAEHHAKELAAKHSASPEMKAAQCTISPLPGATPSTHVKTRVLGRGDPRAGEARPRAAQADSRPSGGASAAAQRSRSRRSRARSSASRSRSRPRNRSGSASSQPSRRQRRSTARQRLDPCRRCRRRRRPAAPVRPVGAQGRLSASISRRTSNRERSIPGPGASSTTTR